MNNEVYFSSALDGLKKAICNIAKNYFCLPTADDDMVYRERVYCYELYHQWRLTNSIKEPIFLNGEVDKRAHPIIQGSQIPDFLVHEPGTMENNIMIVEVKSISSPTRLITRDFRKQLDFIQKYRYFGAVQLLFGPPDSKFETEVCRIIETEKTIIRDCKSPFYLFWHQKVSELPKGIQLNH